MTRHGNRAPIVVAALVGLALATAPGAAAPGGAAPRTGRGDLAERRVVALLRSKGLRFTFGDDGVMTCLGAHVREVDAIVALGPRAIPALIAHLDDTRELPTTYMAANYAAREVPLGMACFDILASVVADGPPVFTDPACEGDGVRECVDVRYSLDPDDFRMTKAGYRATRRVREVRRNWERAYRADRLRFVGCPPDE
jgi:hypothetical protein